MLACAEAVGIFFHPRGSHMWGALRLMQRTPNGTTALPGTKDTSSAFFLEDLVHCRKPCTATGPSPRELSARDVTETAAQCSAVLMRTMRFGKEARSNRISFL